MNRHAMFLIVGFVLGGVVAWLVLGTRDAPQNLRRNDVPEADASTSSDDPALWRRTPIHEPARDATLVTVRMHGAIACNATGFVGTPNDYGREKWFVFRSSELVSSRAWPAWSVSIANQANRITGVTCYIYAVPYAKDATAFTAKPTDDDWDVTSDELTWTLSVRLTNPKVAQPITLRCQVHWPAPRDPNPAPAHVLAVLANQTGMEVRPFSSFDFGRSKDPECASVIYPTEEAATEALSGVRAALPDGWVAFLGVNRWLNDEATKGQELAVAPGRSWQDCVRAARVDPVNYELSSESVVRWLAEYDYMLGVDVVLANTDTLIFTCKRAPDFEHQFVDDIIRFCHDAQNSGRHFVDDMVASGRIALWWD